MHKKNVYAIRNSLKMHLTEFGLLAKMSMIRRNKCEMDVCMYRFDLSLVNVYVFAKSLNNRRIKQLIVFCHNKINRDRLFKLDL